MGIEEHLGYNVLTTTLEKLVDWGRKNSLWPATFGLACCAIEMICTAANRWDIARFGMEAFRASPRQADVIIIAGTVCKKMMPAIQRVYDQMSEPKWVIAMGACATSGGIFDSYAVVQGIDKYLPVDVYVPGCPPRPEGLLYGILKLHEQILKDPFLTTAVQGTPAGSGGRRRHETSGGPARRKVCRREWWRSWSSGATPPSIVKPERIVDICTALKDGHDTGFKYLSMIAGHGLLSRTAPGSAWSITSIATSTTAASP